MLPGVFGAGVLQINLVVSTAIASLLPTGSVSYLNYADRLNQLPLAVLGIAVGTAILPPLSRQVRLGDEAAAITTQNRGLELALLLTAAGGGRAGDRGPADPGGAVPARRVHRLRHRRHRAGARRLCRRTARLRPGQGDGAGLFARQDTKTPVKIAALTMAVNVALTLALGWLLAHDRHRHGALHRRLGQCAAADRGAAPARPFRARCALAARGPAHRCWRRWAWRRCCWRWSTCWRGALAGRFAAKLAALAALIGGGLGGFALLALLLGIADLGELRRRLGRRTA